MKKTILIVAIFLYTGFLFTACTGNNNKADAGQLAKDEMYTCTMHNEVMSDHTGECPKCGMNLVKQKMTADQLKMMNEGTYVKPKE